MKFIYDLHHAMDARNIILAYEGDFTHDTTKSILTMAERNLESSGEDAGIKKKIFNVMVEALQNIVKHSDDKKDGQLPNHAAIFLIGYQENRYSIISGNPIRRENISSLNTALERINSLDKEGLKVLYKEIIKNTTISDKGGAGLGFVDMARKSGEKLEWSFVDMNEEFSFFCLKISIGRGVE